MEEKEKRQERLLSKNVFSPSFSSLSLPPFPPISAFIYYPFISHSCTHIHCYLFISFHIYICYIVYYLFYYDFFDVSFLFYLVHFIFYTDSFIFICFLFTYISHYHCRYWNTDLLRRCVRSSEPCRN